MKKYLSIAALAILTVLAAVDARRDARAASADGPDAESLVAEVLAHPKDFSVGADVSMTRYLENGDVQKAQWKMLRSIRDQNDMMRFEILEPKEKAGSVLIARRKGAVGGKEAEIWFYDAKKDKTKQLTGRKRFKEFMKSGFTYEEIVEDFSPYSHFRPLSFAIVDGKKCRLVEGRENADPKKPGRRIRFWISTGDLSLVKIEYQDKKGLPVKAIKASGFVDIGGKMMPRKLELTHAKDRTRTILNVDNTAIVNQPDEKLFDHGSLAKNERKNHDE